MSDDEDYNSDEDEIFGKQYDSTYKQPLLHSDNHVYNNIYHNPKPVLLTARFFQRNTLLAQICVMISVVLERAAYYSLLGNLYFFVNSHLRFTSGDSAQLVMGFSGMTWISCFIGGFLGDVVLGRFRTIITGLILYVVGFANLPIMDYLNRKKDYVVTHDAYVTWLILTLVIISLGEGCFKSNMSPFGADQLGKTADNEVRTYFSYFYWAINIGSLFGFSLLTWIQQYYNFTTGYIIPCGMLLLALIIFCIPRTTHYHVITPSGNILKKIFKICYNAIKGRSMGTDYEAFNPIQHWLDRSKVKYGGKFTDCDVEDTKTVLSILPVFGFLIIYCTCYFQTTSTYLQQTLHMKLIHFSKDDPVPASWFMMFDVIIVLIFVPIVDRYIHPLIESCGVRAPLLFRMAIGIFLATLSMVAAGTVETYRLENNSTYVNIIESNNITAKHITVGYQLPQYALMGISEIFVLITGLEFAYSQSPKSMQSFVTSLFFIANGIGALLGSLFIYLGNTLHLHIYNIHDGPTKHSVPALKGHLSYFFYFLGALNFLNLFFFIIFIRWRTRKKKRRELEKTVAAYIQDSMEASRENNLRSH